MKKEYIAPKLFEIAIHSERIMQAASGGINQTDDETATVTPSDTEYSGNDWTSRRHDVWDEEEEEDF